MSDLLKEYRKTMAAEVLHLWAADAVAEIARLRAETDALRTIIAPFAEYERVRSAMGGNSPKEGILLGVHSSAGSAELSVEDFKEAQAAMGADA